MTDTAKTEQPRQTELDQIDKDMARKFHSDFDSFLTNFAETWEDSVCIASIIMTQILVLQKVSIDIAEIIVEDCAKQDFDLLAELDETLEKRIGEIKLEHNINIKPVDNVDQVTTN